METNVKKREWVKTVAIIFLAVMLVLTFFSNTIMNHSLPEVATANVTSGTINAKIRGQGTVSANETYDVTIKQTRKVASIKVKAGQEVAAGRCPRIHATRSRRRAWPTRSAPPECVA